jgi:hypothetical protein
MPITHNRPSPKLVAADVEADHERRAAFAAYRLAGMGAKVKVNGIAYDNNSRSLLLDLVNDMTGRIPHGHISQPNTK